MFDQFLQNEAYSNKKLQDKPIRGQISFETHFQILP